MYKSDKLFTRRIKTITKFGKVRDYKSKSEDESIKILSEPKQKINFSKLKIEEIRKKFKELRDRFSK